VYLLGAELGKEGREGGREGGKEECVPLEEGVRLEEDLLNVSVDLFHNLLVLSWARGRKGGREGGREGGSDGRTLGGGASDLSRTFLMSLLTSSTICLVVSWGRKGGMEGGKEEGKKKDVPWEEGHPT